LTVFWLRLRLACIEDINLNYAYWRLTRKPVKRRLTHNKMLIGFHASTLAK